MRTLDLWLATPDAARHFDVARLDAHDAQRWTRLHRSRRRAEWQASRALRAAVAVPPDAATSLTHSAGFAALAVAPPGIALGVDLETLRPRDWLALAGFAFAPEERLALQALPEAGRPLHFYTLWTLKEAAAKALGLELLVATRTCRFRCHDGLWSGTLPGAAHWRAWVYAPRGNLLLAALAVATSATLPDDPPRQREWPTASDAGAGWTAVAQARAQADAPADAPATRPV